jgi:hypothetical protein
MRHCACPAASCTDAARGGRGGHYAYSRNDDNDDARCDDACYATNSCCRRARTAASGGDSHTYPSAIGCSSAGS